MNEVDGLIERLTDQICRRGLGVAAVFVLESSKPLTLVGSQFLIFCQPLVRMLAELPDYPLLVRLLEDRAHVEALICAVEARLESAA